MSYDFIKAEQTTATTDSNAGVFEMYYAKEIDSKVAREYVKKYHYSGKVVSNSKIHLGVFNEENELVGVLQFGYPMNGVKTSSKILGDKKMMELNRMVMRDEEPRNSESKAIGVCMKWIKTNTDLDYILSFSDGKEGNVGYIYQATNWLYIGYLLSDSFYKIDNETVHAVTVWHKYKEKHALRDTHTTNEIVCLEHGRVSKVTSKQHVYLYPMNKSTRKNIVSQYKIKPYPKKDKELRVLKEVVYKDDNGVYLPNGVVKLYSDEVLQSCY